MNVGDEAQSVADMLVGMEDVQREVLIESVRNGKESGRTICGEDTVLDPGRRGFRAVEIKSCPRGGGGIMHGGGGHDFMSPVHSIPDMAIVLFSDVSASLVVGAEESDLMVAPEDKAEGIRVFNAVTGLSAETLDDVDFGEIENFGLVRSKLRSELSSLLRTVETPHEISPEAVQETPTAGLVGDPFARVLDTGDRVVNAVADLLTVIRSVLSFDLRDVDINLAQILIDEAATALTLLVLFGLFGGRPSRQVEAQMAQS